MVTGANTAIVRRHNEEMRISLRLDLAEELIASNIRLSGWLGEQVKGRDGLKHNVAKVGVAGSSPVSRSRRLKGLRR